MNKQDTLTESQRKAREQFEVQRRKVKESTDKHLGPAAQKERERIARGGTNFALFNYILQTLDLTGCNDPMDAMRELYKRFYVHLKRVVDENKEMRNIINNNINKLSKLDAKRAERIFKTKEDPNDLATDMLNNVKDDAKKRAKIGLKSYQPKR